VALHLEGGTSGGRRLMVTSEAMSEQLGHQSGSQICKEAEKKRIVRRRHKEEGIEGEHALLL
jgi:hypothetical protein